MNKSIFARGVFWMVWSTLCLWPALGVAAERPVHTYALIVANNDSLDSDLAPLRYADNDAAKYFQLFNALGATVRLHAVLDAAAQKQFVTAAQTARTPDAAHVLESVEQLFDQMKRANDQGIDTHFVFIYSGHGGVGPNREGYITFLDKKFGRNALYKNIIGKSPASFNHIILDACNAYYFVNKRGSRATASGDHSRMVQQFLQRETLKSYPNTGVILAASAESETHEWSRWEAGVFSHELRSALLGAGDVNGDGHVTYAEAAACVEAANAGIDVPRARLKVYYRPPAMQTELPLFNGAAVGDIGRL